MKQAALAMMNSGLERHGKTTKQQNRLHSLRITKHLQPLALHTIGFDEEDVDLRSMAAIRKREHLLRYVAVCQASRHKGPLFGLRIPLGFYENGVGVACRNVRFT